MPIARAVRQGGSRWQGARRRGQSCWNPPATRNDGPHPPDQITGRRAALAGHLPEALERRNKQFAECSAKCTRIRRKSHGDGGRATEPPATPGPWAGRPRPPSLGWRSRGSSLVRSAIGVISGIVLGGDRRGSDPQEIGLRGGRSPNTAPVRGLGGIDASCLSGPASRRQAALPSGRSTERRSARREPRRSPVSVCPISLLTARGRWGGRCAAPDHRLTPMPRWRRADATRCGRRRGAPHRGGGTIAAQRHGPGGGCCPEGYAGAGHLNGDIGARRHGSHPIGRSGRGTLPAPTTLDRR